MSDDAESVNGKAILGFLRTVDQHAERYALAADTAGTVQVLSRSFKGEALEAMAARFWLRADSRAEQSQGAELRFMVVAYEANKQVIDSHTFTVGDEVTDGLASLTAELPATASGVTRAAMRIAAKRESISLKMLGFSTRTAERTISHQARVIEAREQRIEKLEAKVDKLNDAASKQIALREKLKSKAHKRRLKQLDAEESSHFKAFFMQHAVNAIPIVLDSLNGGGKFKRLLRTIRPEQLDAIGKVFDEDQRGEMMALMRSGIDAEDAHKRLGETSIMREADPNKKTTQKESAAEDA